MPARAPRTLFGRGARLHFGNQRHLHLMIALPLTFSCQLGRDLLLIFQNAHEMLA